jgi:hypothetical protein
MDIAARLAKSAREGQKPRRRLIDACQCATAGSQT